MSGTVSSTTDIDPPETSAGVRRARLDTPTMNTEGRLVPTAPQPAKSGALCDDAPLGPDPAGAPVHDFRELRGQVHSDRGNRAVHGSDAHLVRKPQYC